jgi:hypothetical protein
MCGIVGFITKDPGKGYYARENFMQEGLAVDSLRGQGGTGLGLVRGAGEIEVHKRALSGPDFLNTQVADLAFKNFENVRVAIGHNRAATIGSVKDKNCHPFHYAGTSEIMLVHNGTLNDYYRMNPTSFNHEVDSAHAAHALANGENPQKILKEIRGPFVFVWWNGTDHTFNIARNEFREIYHIYDKAGNLFYASEYKMLDWLLARNNIEKPEKSQYLYPEDNNWLQWPFDEKGQFGAKPVCYDIKPEKREVSYPRKFLGFEGADGTTKRERKEFRRNGIHNLDTLGLKNNELIIAEIVTFEDYATSGRLTDRGKMILTPKFSNVVEEIWVHGIERSEYNTYVEAHKDHFPIRVRSCISSWGATEHKEDEWVLIGGIEPKDVLALEDFQKRKANEKLASNSVKSAVEKVLEKIGGGVEPEDDLDDPYNQTLLFVGPNKTWFTRDGWKNLVARGCSYCAETPDIENPKGVVWLQSSGDFLCEICANDPQARELCNLEVLPIENLKSEPGFGTARLNN